MLTIFADSFLTATRNEKWKSPDHWSHDGRKLKGYEAERVEAERRQRAKVGGVK
ncbi:hypothetical protein CLV80_111117 [Yoonia maritima]|uniref:Uncharacterized protein n=1 Tax=Yoonia maritima TaxID=1435347 RepID=A0A2T0VVV7_9RHOB|nr:hypothetical protein [Yoonia maritima]PRY75766.1 hypothetical protein CLV80_111117 [Yoonia maritima]